MTAADPAVQAAAEAMCEDDAPCAMHHQYAEAAVAAARPHIAAEVRAEVAAAIRAEASWVDALTITHQDRTTATVLQIKREALLEAARIAEEGDQ